MSFEWITERKKNIFIPFLCHVLMYIYWIRLNKIQNYTFFALLISNFLTASGAQLTGEDLQKHKQWCGCGWVEHTWEKITLRYFLLSAGFAPGSYAKLHRNRAQSRLRARRLWAAVETAQLTKRRTPFSMFPGEKDCTLAPNFGGGAEREDIVPARFLYF